MRLAFLLLFASTLLRAQSEIKWTVNLNTQQITQTDANVFKTLEQELVNFLNSRTWTDDVFQEEERIEATLFLTLSEATTANGDNEEIIPNRYTGTLAIQSARPIFGTGEVTPVLNYQDKRLEFTYEQFQAIQLSDQTFTSELSSIIGFYAYIVLGMDYDTFSALGGQPYFEQAQQLYNRLPAALLNSGGWTSAGKTNNRYLLLENLLSPRMLPMRRAAYTYHRLGLDQMLTDPLAARQNITLAIQDVQSANQVYPNSALVQSFVDAKREEIIQIYTGATGAEQNAIIEMLSRIDPSKAGSYREIRSGGSGAINRRQAGKR
ncbi:uncharacterized protein DUF4835 [Neolewinella xylanilytica]|uniref:Uncharacterized protein DUF4835 n=1 Tax=Neolewinella xylanilytica TaxID=1514080 RepID=A0A2S6HZZ1_9BACT|nr:DUF4835 family protein [Neolewinella xylanilytica]PPK84077.1 uncharacterized protein DUF4835 [Neolewinella xylanilytica]